MNPWKFNFTPYGINGNVTAGGHAVDVDESFIEIAEHADSFAALMGYFEARKGRWGILRRCGVGRSWFSRPFELRHQYI